MTKAIRIHEHGGPEVCSYDDIDIGAPGEGQVRLKHTAIGVNYLDIYHRSGAHKIDNLPVPIGMEGAGVV
ncbi:MAG: quinone oxidoreductase, partial [Rhodospirillales bacterium]|nr:quinone oxidoreductase [Rhodospirillales bacterium]